ncbi:MAG: tetratricopeptide repeat protein [Pyrinomonadaceae bacterium]
MKKIHSHLLRRFSGFFFIIPALIIFQVLFVSNLPGQPTGGDDLQKANQLFEEALKLNGQGTAQSYREAFEKFQQAEKLYKKAGEKSGEAKSLVGSGFTSDSLGEKTRALEFYQNALPIFRELDDKFWEARTLNNIARLYDTTGEKKKALNFYEQALQKRKEVGDRYGESVTLNNIGAVYADLGEKEKALNFYLQALSLRRSLGNQRGEAITLNNIGRIYDELGEKQKAIEFFEQSLVLRKTVGDRRGTATTLNNLGLVYSDLGDYPKALSLFNDSLTIIRELGDKSEEAVTLNNIGTVFLADKTPDKALEFFEKALPIHQNAGNKSGEATVLNNLGLAFSDLGQLQKARENFYRALPILQSLGEKNVEAITLSNLMIVWNLEKNPTLALFYGKQAVNKYQELREAIRGLDSQTQKIYLKSIESNYRRLADLLIESGRFSQAEQVLQMLKEEEYFEFVRRDVDEIKNLKKRVSLSEKEQKLIERYAQMAEKITLLGQEFFELAKKKRQLFQMDSGLSTDEQKRYDRLSAQLADANAAFRLFLEKELIQELGREKTSGIEIDRNLQNQLRKWGDGTVALYTVVSEDRYRVILTTPTVQVDGKTEISATELNKKVFAFREALQDIETDPRLLGKELYDILLKPIEKDLIASEAKTLIWSLDGTLRYIPLATLSPDGKTYLVEKYQNVILTPKTRDNITDAPPTFNALAVGVSLAQTVQNPDDPNRKIIFGPLPGTREELFKIVRTGKNPEENGILPGERFIDEDFTLKNLVNSLTRETSEGKRNFNIVHIASHFRLGSNWTNSFLLLGNGQILTLEEVSNSPEINFGDIDLVTLSACNTAFGGGSNGKEIDSLAGAIQNKSGKSILATLWSVVDESTPILMSEFYRFRKDHPQKTKAEAIQFVQKGMISGELKPDQKYIEELAGIFGVRGSDGSKSAFVFEKEKPFAHPYFWSPFVLIGNWR